MIETYLICPKCHSKLVKDVKWTYIDADNYKCVSCEKTYAVFITDDYQKLYDMDEEFMY